MYCVPHYRYSCQAYTDTEEGSKRDKEQKEEIERGYRRSFKMALNVPKTTSTKWVNNII